MALTERLAFVIDAKSGGAVSEFRKVGKELDKLGDDVKRSGGLIDRFADRAGLSAGALKAGLATAAVTAGGALVKFGFDAAQAASDLSEQMSNTRVTFEGASKTVVDFSRTAATELGLSQTAALEASNTFGAFFTNIGLGSDTAADLSVGMVRLSGDIASFKNVAGGAEEVAVALRSGLSGEAEPLRKFGIFLDEAKTKSKAMELGLAGAHGELTDGAKIVSRYALILDQSGKAQGDFARTSGSLANQQRILSASWDNLKANLGAEVTPIITGLVGTLADLTNRMESVTESGEKQDNFWQRFVQNVRDTIGPMSGWNMLAEEQAKKSEQGADAQSKFSMALDRYRALTEDSKTSTSALTQAKKELQSAAGALKAKQDGLNEALKTEADRAKEADAALSKLRGGIVGYAEAQRGVESASRRLGDAEQNLKEKRQALAELLRKPIVDEKELAAARRSVEQATRGVAAAEERATEARERLNKARSYDPDDLADASLSLREAELGVADAQDAVKDAQREVNEARAAGDPDELADAERRLTGAELSLERAQRTRAQAQQAINDINPNSEAGARRVAEAERDLAMAEQSVKDAQQARSDAQTRLTEVAAGDRDRAAEVAAAKRDLRDAEIAVADAQWGSVQAALNLNDAAKKQAEAFGADADAVRRFREELYLLGLQHPVIAGLLGALGAGLQGQGIANLGPMPGTPSAANVQRRASGGWLNPGATSWVGENGPELIRLGSSGGMVYPNTGGGAPVYLTVNAGFGADGAEIGQKIVDALRRVNRTSGPLPISVRG